MNFQIFNFWQILGSAQGKSILLEDPGITELEPKKDPQTPVAEYRLQEENEELPLDQSTTYLAANDFKNWDSDRKIVRIPAEEHGFLVRGNQFGYSNQDQLHHPFYLQEP